MVLGHIVYLARLWPLVAHLGERRDSHRGGARSRAPSRNEDTWGPRRPAGSDCLGEGGAQNHAPKGCGVVRARPAPNSRRRARRGGGEQAIDLGRAFERLEGWQRQRARVARASAKGRCQ